MERKAQIFIMDLIIAIVIISMIILVYFQFYTNQDIGGEMRHLDVLSEAKTISDYLTSEGYPPDWNESTVVRIGITDNNNVINPGKISMFSNMTKSNYNLTRDLLRTKYDYVIFFKDYDGNIIDLTDDMYIGMPGVNDTNIHTLETAHISKISRFVVQKQGSSNVTARIVEMVIYVWTIAK